MASPVVSVIIVTYNQQSMVRAALESVLAQDHPSMEVLVFDDRSTDGTWSELEAVAAAYAGPHALVLHRQPKNVGPTRNLNAARAAARGRWHVKNDGDDVSLPGRVRRVVEAGEAAGAGLVATNAFLMDADGNDAGLYRPRDGNRTLTASEIAVSGWSREMLGATFAYRADLIAVFGNIDETLLPSGGDHIWPLRAGLLFPGGMLYLDEPLLRYRQHGEQMTRRVGDRTQSPEVFDETMCGHNITATLQQLRDLQLLARVKPGDPTVGQLQAALIQRLVREVNHWTRVRNGLLLAGFRPTWVPRDQLDAVTVADAFEPLPDDG